jgi:hypothetical protein
MRLLAFAILTAVLGCSAGCARAAQPPPLLQPLAVDWPSYFTIDSQATPADGRALVSGTVTNTTGWRARRIQLLVEGLDATGRVMSQRVVWLGVDLTPANHAYFEVPVAPTSASYRVQVFAFETGRRK